MYFMNPPARPLSGAGPKDHTGLYYWRAGWSTPKTRRQSPVRAHALVAHDSVQSCQADFPSLRVPLPLEMEKRSPVKIME